MTDAITYQTEHTGTRAQYSIFWRICLAIGLGMFLALVLIRLFALAFNASADTFLGRVLEARAALPQILAEPEDLVMFYGSSMVQAGFSPRQFDREMAERGIDVKSFNFGFGGLNPLFQEVYARRIREAFEAENRRLKLVMIEFNPFQTTRTRRDRARSAEDAFLAVLASPQELFEYFLDDPERGLLMYNIRYLRDGVSAEMATNFFGEPFRARRQRTDIAADEEMDALRRELGQKLNAKFEEEYPDYDGCNWCWNWQGGGTLPEERSQETLDLVWQYYPTQQTDQRMDNDRLSRVHTADIENLDFDPELVDAFIGIVRNFQMIADQVEVVLLPKNTDWIKNPPDAIARQQAVIERIERETGVQIRNYQVIDAVSNDMFTDTTHLNRYHGAVAFTGFLVDEFAPELQ